MNDARNNQAVQDILAGLDVDMVGVARIEDIENSEVAKQALDLLPFCRSIVAFAMEIWPEFLDLTVPHRMAGAPKMNDLLDRHKNYLRGRLIRAAYDVAKESRKQGFKALPMPGEGPSVDNRFLKAIISYKEAARLAGLGDLGMSGLLVTQQYGPRVLLNICLTEADLASTARDEAAACRYCNICVFKCPARAVGYPKRDAGEKYAVNAFACSQYVTSAGGCSECMRVCPVASPKYG